MQQYPLLEQVNSPAQLKTLPAEELSALCAEIREFLIRQVSRTGGHLASNLGAVELTVAIHRVFSSPEDDIVFDVGHQCYVHKMLTGRRERFDTLRQLGGISGFLRPGESEYDCVVSGHASVSVSEALGLARAKAILGQTSATVCVIGDGALTGGMAYEAMNDAGQSGLPLVVVFNDNDMSISRNVGAVAKRLSAIRLKPNYFRMKEGTKRALRRLPGGEGLIRGVSAVKKRLRTAILKETLFELLGFDYLGPADGNDVSAVCSLLEQAKKRARPVVVHLKTVKGKGYLPSEQAPASFHGVSSFDAVTGSSLGGGKASFSSVFGSTLCDLARQDGRICAVTAAMTDGTGLSPFAGAYPDRFFDVGIAEEHAVTMAAGMAVRGLRPVCAIYSTFLQRGYDQLLHDVAIQGNPVVFAVDRAGLVGADGETHQGIFDVPYLRTVPGLRLLSPSSFAELRRGLEQALLREKGPTAIRYPRGGEGAFTGDTFDRTAALLRPGKDVVLCTYGILVNQALAAAEKLAAEGVDASVVKINDLSAWDRETVLEPIRACGRVLVLEDCVETGSFGQELASVLASRGISARVRLCNLGDRFVPQGKVEELYKLCHIDEDSVFRAAKELCHE